MVGAGQALLFALALLFGLLALAPDIKEGGDERRYGAASLAALFFGIGLVL